MKIFRTAAEAAAGIEACALTIGNYDGVHAGHREILRRLKACAAEQGIETCVLTFDPHPAAVLAPERAPKLIQTIEQRLARFEEVGVENVLVMPFSLELARLTPEEFVRDIVVNALHARLVMVGEDFRFGYRQSGSTDTLAGLGLHYGFAFEAVSAVQHAGARASSTRIRELIAAGKPSRACRMLCGPFALIGNVVSGHGIGSKQTVPTLNLAAENLLLPKPGVYATRTRDCGSARRWHSITNVGYRPTFEGSQERSLTVETFLLDSFDGLTPSRIEVEFLAWVRDEKRFDSPEALRKQILIDAGCVQRFHRRIISARVG